MCQSLPFFDAWLILAHILQQQLSLDLLEIFVPEQS